MTWPNSISVGINVRVTPVCVFVIPSLLISNASLWKRRASDVLSGNYTSTERESSSIVVSVMLSRTRPFFMIYSEWSLIN
jgi:hypothetical protein